MDRNMIVPFLVFLLSSTQALPNGAPSTVCQTMMPFHGGGIAPQNGISPYSLVPRRQGDVVVVSVGSTLGVRFEGFMLQARTPYGEVLGSFQLGSEMDGHTLECAQPGDSVTHNSASEKDHLDVFWTPPQGYEGPVVFNSTIAQNYNTFWVGVQSPQVQITRRAVNDPIPNRPNRPLTTTPPNYVPEVPRESSTDFDPFYDGCSVNKKCFGAPSDCVRSKSCKSVVAVTVTGDVYDFEMKAEGNAAWVGVGLSDDDKMGGDSVIECVKTPSGIKTYMSYTTARPFFAVRLSNPQLGIQLLNSSIVNGDIYCKVRRNVETIVNGTSFNLVNNKYYLLIASGLNVTDTSVRYHDLTYSPSGEAQSLADVSEVAAASKILVRLHGSFMLAAWIGSASVGILLARYYRQTWVGTTMMGKDLWFAWHRVFMVLTWALTIAGFVLIFVELKAWSEETPHAVLGTITSVLCFIQPIGAYFRPHPGTSKRSIFNWLHWLVGNTAHIIGIVTIFFAVKLAKAELPEFMDYILAAYVAVHVITHLLLSAMNCISEKSTDGRVSSFPMKDLGGSGRSSAFADRSLDAPYSTLRKIVLVLYILLILVFVLALIVITALAPIESELGPLLKKISN